jgi:hypothetical protein
MDGQSCFKQVFATRFLKLVVRFNPTVVVASFRGHFVST